ncbi:hypothetical protein BDW74DRAFT_161109 [Aspergillus multicolor]|uniref:uncharacterized protein n=1 Tax=Aspergillus multicolor TaxID=41759 RepID=UPI003CCDDDEC
MKTPTRLKEQRIPNEAKWAFLNDDEPPKTYARLWDIMVTEQGFLPHQFQVYGVIAQRADTEDPGVGGIEVKEPPLIATERQARFPPLKSSLDLDLEVRAKHKDLGYLTGTARIQLKRSGKPPKSPRDSRRSLKRKIEELVEENRRLKRRLEESDSTGKNGPLTAVGNTADAGAKIGEKTRPAENSTGDDEDQVVDLTGDDEALAENSTADDEDQAQAQAGKARPAENSTGLDEDRAKARAREAREQMVKMFAEVVRAAQTTAGVPAKWPLERLEKAWRCLDDRKPPPEYAQEFYDWFNPTGAWMRFQEIASETIEQLAATTAGMAPDAQAAQEEATRRDIEAVLAQMEAEWSALQLKEFWQGLQQVLQWMPLNPAEQAYYDRFKGLCTPREPFDLTTTPLTNLQSPPATTPKAQPAEEVELWGNVEAFTSRFNAERTEGEPNADDLTGDEWLEFVNLPSSSQPNNGSSPEVNCPPAPDLGIDPADIDKLATHDNGGADQ